MVTHIECLYAELLYQNYFIQCDFTTHAVKVLQYVTLYFIQQLDPVERLLFFYWTRGIP